MEGRAKKTHLPIPMSKEKFVAKLAATLQAGGQVEATPVEPEVGDEMPDGTIYAGISPETNKPMFTTLADAPLSMTFNQAKEYAANLDAHGHQDWRVPTKGELNLLFDARAAIGAFNVTGSYDAGWYWSASEYDLWTKWSQRFGDGCRIYCDNDGHLSVRCVR
jgi:hypothetical protein